MTTPSSSFAQIPSPAQADDVDSLPSSPADTDDSSSTDDYGESDAEREWRESLQQLELLLTMVLIPYLGKYFGRRCAYWGQLDHLSIILILTAVAWGKVMEMKYPVKVEITNPTTFRAAGAIQAAASL